jgi:hypothetical protein
LTSMYVLPLLANSPSHRPCFAVDTTNFTFPVTSANLIWVGRVNLLYKCEQWNTLPVSLSCCLIKE